MADPKQDSSVLDVSVLGPLEVRLEGVPVRLTGRRAPGLFALLATRPGHVVSTSEVLREVWGESAPRGDTARNALQARVSALRRALGGGAIRATESGYVLEAPAAAVDAARFAEEIRRARTLRVTGRADGAAAAYAGALNLWREETAYAGLGHVPRLALEARRLAELRLQVLQEWFALQVASGRYEEVADELLTATRRHGSVEELWALRMIGLNGQGRQAAALAVYAEARERLRGEYGLDPGPRLRDLETQILRQEPVAAGGVRFIGPPRIARPATSFVGRERELATVTDLLQEARLVTVTGPGGVGKTRLALEAAQRLVDVYAPAVTHGVAVVDMTGRVPGEEPAATVLSALNTIQSGIGEGAPGHRAAPATEALCDLLGDRQMLLVLDNCDTRVDAVAALVADLHARTEAITVLATSRELLGVPGESAYALAPLPLPGPGDAPDEVPAVRLFLDRARATRPACEPDAGRLELVARICARLDGLPLALELAAGRARLLGGAELAHHLEDRLGLDAPEPRTIADRHRSLARAIGWSHDLLSARDRRTFAVLSVFAGSFSLEQARQVWTRLGGTDSEAAERVGRLVARSLLQAEPGPSATRFRMLETMREYGAARLRESGEEQAVRDAHAHVYAAYAQRVARALRDERQAHAVSALKADHANIRAALAWSVDHGEGTAAQAIVGALGYLVWMNGGRAWDLVLRTADLPGADMGVRLRALAWLTHLGSVFGHLEEAIACGERAVRLAATDPALMTGELAFAQLARAHALHRLGRRDEGDAVLAEAERVATAAGDQWSLAGCAVVGGLHAVDRGLLDEAAAQFASAAQRYRLCGDLWGRQRAALRQALVFEARGDYPGAAGLLADAHGFVADLDFDVAAPAKAALARATLLSGDIEGGRRIVEALRERGIAARLPEVAARLQQCHAVLLEHDGRTEDAVTAHARAARQLAVVGLVSEASESWARAALLAGPDAPATAEAAREARSLAEATTDPRVRSVELDIRALCEHDDGARAAAGTLRHAHGLARPALLNPPAPGGAPGTAEGASRSRRP